MSSKNLLLSLYKRELNGILRFKKPLKSYSLSSLIGIDRYCDTFLGFSIGCDYIISLTFESIENDSFYTSSYKNIFLNFSTSPVFGGKVTIFHEIQLGLFQNIGMHFHFYQNTSNPDFFIVSITEIDSEFLIIVFGNMPDLLCVQCQNKSCKKHGIVARLSFQLPTSEIPYKNKLHQVTGIYAEKETLVMVLADCEGNIRLVNISYPITISEPHSYPASSFPFCIRVDGRTIVENECDCFYDILPSSDLCSRAAISPIVTSGVLKCQRCLSGLCNIGEECSRHIELPQNIIDKVHNIDLRTVNHRRILLPNQPSVYTCRPCCKKTFLTNIHASYQSLLLYRHENNLIDELTTEYDPIHGEVLGASSLGDIGSYHWRSNPQTSTQPAIITEELVFNTSSWLKNQSAEVSVHCLSIANGKLELTNKLLVHLVDESRDESHLVELDINTGAVTPIFHRQTSFHFCDFVSKAKQETSQWILDLNNDLQVSKGRSLDVIKDHDGIVELIH